MKNCIITNLLGEVNDNSLPVYGSLEWIVKAGQTAFFSLGSNPYATTITITGNGDLKDTNDLSYGKSYTHTGGVWNGPTKIVATGDCIVRCSDFKYTFDYLLLQNVVISSDNIYFNTNPQRTRYSLNLRNSKITGDLNVSKLQIYSSSVSLVGNSGKIYGKFDENLSPRLICNASDEPLLNASSLEGRNDILRISIPMSGDIKYLGDTGVSSENGSLYLHGVRGKTTDNTWTTGSIEDLVDRLIENERTSGTINFEFPAYFKSVYYDGIPLSEYFELHPELTSSNKSIFTWDEHGDVTWDVLP